MSLTLTNYWWLLIWLFAGGAICKRYPKRRELLGDRVVTRWDIWPAFLMVLPYILWAGFRRDGFGDTHMYRASFRNNTGDWTQIPGLFTGEEKDPGFTAFLTFVKPFLGNSDELFLLIIAVFQLACVAWIFRKYATDYWSCIFLFVASTDYLSWMHNGIRQFIAVAMIFAGFDYLVKKKYIPMILLILLASQFHGSALLMIPVIFIVQGKAWNMKTILMVAAAMVVVAFVDRFTSVLGDLLQDTQYDDIMGNEIWVVDDGTNIIRVLVYSVPALISLLGLKYIRAADDPMMNICINCSIVTMALYAIASVTSGIYIGRLPIYTTLQGYIALPWMIDKVFERRSAALVRVLMYGAYLGFFYFQMHFAWGTL